MKLSRLITSAPKNLGELEIAHLSRDSRAPEPATLYFAIEGTQVDGHRFIPTLGSAVVAIIARRGHPESSRWRGDPRVIEVSDPRAELGLAAHRFYGEPSHELLVCGVTGTNGKTTSTYLLEALLKGWGKRTAVLGTIENRFEGFAEPSTHTTPDAIALQAWLRKIRGLGAEALAMEVSSHALHQERTRGIRFGAALYTNLTQDHLDYHGTMEEYFRCKSKLFLDYEVGTRVVHLDGPYGERLARECEAKGVGLITTGSGRGNVDYENLSATAKGIRGKLRVRTSTLSAELEIDSPLLGAFNAQNLAGVAACGIGLGIPAATITQALRTARPVPGRMERVDGAGGGPTVVVDYAHTPDALEKALLTLRALAPRRLVCVFGCGGNRDPGKRPLMGRIASSNADEVYVTSDNPRSEDPINIIDNILAGARGTAGVHRVPDRREAIAQAMAALRPGDILLIAGKGHETHQIIGEEKLPFDDRAVAREHLREHG